MKIKGLHYKLPKDYQEERFCPYCKKRLHYVWEGFYLIGLALDKWVYCSKCKKHFKLGIGGFREFELKEAKEDEKM